MISLRATPDFMAASATARDTRLIRRGSNGDRDDVVGAISRTRAAIGRGDFVGHILARQFGDGVGGGDLHRFVDGLGPHVERAAEDVGKAENVVDLVGVVAAPGCTMASGRTALASSGVISGSGLAIAKMIGALRHALDHLLGQRALDRKAEEHVAACQASARLRALVSTACADLPLVHALGAAAIDHALGIAQDRLALGRPIDFRVRGRRCPPRRRR